MEVESGPYSVLQSIAVGLAALANYEFSSDRRWSRNDLDNIVENGKIFFSDTVLLMRQLAVQSAQADLTEQNLDQMLTILNDSRDFSAFNCRTISCSRDVDLWRGLRCRKTFSLSEASIEDALTEFLLTSRTALLVGRQTVLALLDGAEVRGVLKVCAGRPLTFRADVNPEELVEITLSIFRDEDTFILVEECPKPDLVPRPMDHEELASWPESEQCRYRQTVQTFLEDQERLKRHLNSAKGAFGRMSDDESSDNSSCDDGVVSRAFRPRKAAPSNASGSTGKTDSEHPAEVAVQAGDEQPKTFTEFANGKKRPATTDSSEKSESEMEQPTEKMLRTERLRDDCSEQPQG